MRSVITGLFMVIFTLGDLKASVDLFEDYQTGHCVGHCVFAEAQP